VIGIVILRARGAKGHGAQFIAPMSLIQCSLLAILYVDNTDLLHINMDAEELIDKVHTAIQSAIANWGKLLIATGGSLKPEKCFYHLIDFAWTRKGGWQYIAHHEDEGAAMFIPLPDGTWHQSHTLPSTMFKNHLGLLRVLLGIVPVVFVR
jgi:hypothetical protein